MRLLLQYRFLTLKRVNYPDFSTALFTLKWVFNAEYPYNTTAGRIWKYCTNYTRVFVMEYMSPYFFNRNNKGMSTLLCQATSL